jgi:hypothetical protein
MEKHYWTGMTPNCLPDALCWECASVLGELLLVRTLAGRITAHKFALPTRSSSERLLDDLLLTSLALSLGP